MVVLCKVDFGVHGVDIVDGLALGGCCCRLVFVRQLHWGKVQAGAAIAAIILMNVVFSFDSVLTAIALTESMPVMIASIVISGIVMLALANRVAAFLQKNRAYEVLGLFILLLVGIMLLSEGGHLAKLTLFGGEVHALNKTTFYFSVTVLILVDLVQSRYQKRLLNKT